MKRFALVVVWLFCSQLVYGQAAPRSAGATLNTSDHWAAVVVAFRAGGS